MRFNKEKFTETVYEVSIYGSFERLGIELDDVPEDLKGMFKLVSEITSKIFAYLFTRQSVMPKVTGEPITAVMFEDISQYLGLAVFTLNNKSTDVDDESADWLCEFCTTIFMDIYEEMGKDAEGIDLYDFKNTLEKRYHVDDRSSNFVNTRIIEIVVVAAFLYGNKLKSFCY